jgi:hypothetical protein
MNNNINIEFTPAELSAILYAIRRSDAMEVLSRLGKCNTSIYRGLINAQSKIENVFETDQPDENHFENLLSPIH